MTLRVTRQFGEVLGTDGGAVRVARQYAEVLGSVAPIIYASASNELSMSQDIHVPWKYASLTSTMTLADEQGNFLGVGESFPANTVLNMTHELVTSGLLQDVSSVMSLVQSGSGEGPVYLYLLSAMHINSEVGTPAFERHFEFETEILMTGLAGRGYDIEVSTTMSVAQDMYRHHTPFSAINLVQTVDYGKTKGLEISELDLDHDVLLNAIWSRATTQTLGIGHALTYYVSDPCGVKAYTPYIGENTTDDSPDPPDDALPFAPGLPEDERFQLLYPGLGEATDTVELRAPNLDNRERLAFTRINRETRGGRLTVFADPTWPQINTLVLSFSGLEKAEIDALQTFMVAHLGEEVGLIDWEGRQWVGVITSPTERGVQDGKGCDGRWTIGLEFEGVLLDEAPSGSHMSLSSSVIVVLV